MAGESKTTKEHEVIRRWVEERDGRPAYVEGTERDGDVGVLRIEFPGYGDEAGLSLINWNEFFDKFDEKNLTFLYQDETADGEVSRFFKFIKE
jgi:hypothetical protein